MPIPKYSFFGIFSVYPGTVCVSIEVKNENVTGTYTDMYHITSRKVDGGSDKPIYKPVSGDEYIYYLPDEFGWRIGDIIGNDFGDFSYESKNLVVENLIYFIVCTHILHMLNFQVISILLNHG